MHATPLPTRGAIDQTGFLRAHAHSQTMTVVLALVAWSRRDPRLGLGDLGRVATSDLTQGLDAARGLGWQVQPTDHLVPFSARAFGHMGFTGTSLACDPDRELVVALLTNRVYAGRTHQGIDETRLRLHQIVAEE